MSDWSELRLLAEAATQGKWRTGEWMPKETVGHHQVVVETDIGPYVILEGNQNFIEDAEKNAAFVAAANPGLVLELIAENERLDACLKWEQNRAERVGTHGPGCESWGPAHYECLLRERDQMRIEIEALRKDAGRFNWLAERLEDIQIDGADACEHCTEEEESWPMLWRRAIDAVISQEGDSDG